LVLWKAHEAVSVFAERSIGSLGLGHTDFRILEALLHKGPLNVNSICPIVQLTAGSVSVAIDRLEKKEYVERHADPEDGRARIVHLTAAGRSAIEEAFAKGKCGTAASEHVVQDMWEKWVFLASLAASTSLMRTSVGNILAAPGGKDFLLGVLDECSAVATAEGFPPNGPFFQRTRGMLTTEGSPMTASMFRDIKVGAPVEADHVIGDLIARGDAAKVPVPRLRIAYTHLKAYEKARG